MRREEKRVTRGEWAHFNDLITAGHLEVANQRGLFSAAPQCLAVTRLGEPFNREFGF